jgi:hypothetical protein
MDDTYSVEANIVLEGAASFLHRTKRPPTGSGALALRLKELEEEL